MLGTWYCPMLLLLAWYSYRQFLIPYLHLNYNVVGRPTTAATSRANFLKLTVTELTGYMCIV